MTATCPDCGAPHASPDCPAQYEVVDVSEAGIDAEEPGLDGLQKYDEFGAPVARGVVKVTEGVRDTRSR